MKTNMTTIDLNKVRMYVQENTGEKYNVVVGSTHQVEGQNFVIASRVGKPGLVRVSAESIKEV